jgi:predicted RNA-binding protein (virulence factor B family)
VINEHITLGKYNHLKIDRDTEHGLFLKASDNESSVLLPGKYITDDMNIGDVIKVFIYLDSNDKQIATTNEVVAQLGEFGCFEVSSISSFGAFMKWGVDKELLVPKSKQKRLFYRGDKKILRIETDEETGRLIGVERVQKYLQNASSKDLKINQECELLVIASTPLGYKVIVDHLYEGMIFKNEIFQKVSIGDKLFGYIKTIREDGKLDLKLQPTGELKDDLNSARVLGTLATLGGKIDITSKSSPQEIEENFKMSKKSFKATLVKLQKENKIKVEDGTTSII